jgi:hypothetical protein
VIADGARLAWYLRLELQLESISAGETIILLRTQALGGIEGKSWFGGEIEKDLNGTLNIGDRL